MSLFSDFFVPGSVSPSFVSPGSVGTPLTTWSCFAYEGDSMTETQLGMNFSTRDQDNDKFATWNSGKGHNGAYTL